MERSPELRRALDVLSNRFFGRTDYCVYAAAEVVLEAARAGQLPAKPLRTEVEIGGKPQGIIFPGSVVVKIHGEEVPILADPK